MGAYVSVAQVSARVSYRVIDANSEPNDTQVGEWIDEGEALIESALAGAGVVVPIVGAKGIILMRSWVLDYPVGHLFVAYASAGGDGDNDDGESHLERFFALEADINKDPSKYSQRLAQGQGPDQSRRVRSHILDHPDGNSTGAGDFTPKFTRDDFN